MKKCFFKCGFHPFDLHELDPEGDVIRCAKCGTHYEAEGYPYVNLKLTLKNMKPSLEDYVIQLSTAKRLYEAGVTKRTTFYVWDNLSHLRLRSEKEFQLHPALPDGKTVPGDYQAYPALLQQELIELLVQALPNGDVHLEHMYTGPFRATSCFIETEEFEKNGTIPCDHDSNWIEGETSIRVLEALAIYLLDQELWPLNDTK